MGTLPRRIFIVILVDEFLHFLGHFFQISSNMGLLGVFGVIWCCFGLDLRRSTAKVGIRSHERASVGGVPPSSRRSWHHSRDVEPASRCSPSDPRGRPDGCLSVPPGWSGWAIRIARIGLRARTGSRKKVKKVPSQGQVPSRTSPCLGVENIGHTLGRKKR